MQPSKPFLFVLALTAVGAAIIVTTPKARSAAAQDAMPLSTKLTPEMTDFFGLAVAYEHPSLTALVACGRNPACGGTDSTRVRFVDADGMVVPDYDGAPTSTIQQVRHARSTPSEGVTVTRTEVRLYTKDEQGRLVMNGIDSVQRVNATPAGSAPFTVTSVNHYTDVKYLVNDPRFQWPLTGLVVADLSVTGPKVTRQAATMASHAAVNFDGTPYAHIITTGALTHRVDLQAKVLETTIPDR